MTLMISFAIGVFRGPPVQLKEIKSTIKGSLKMMLFIFVLLISVRYFARYTHSEWWACVCFVGLMFIGVIMKRIIVRKFAKTSLS